MFKFLGHLSPLLGHLSPILAMSFAEDAGGAAGAGAAAGAGVVDTPPVKEITDPPAGEPTWLDTFPEEAKKDPNITKYKNAEELYKGHKNLVELVGKKGVILPGENAKPEDWDKFYNEIGRPAKAEEYKFTPLKDLHPDLKSTPEGEKVYAGIAHKYGLTNKQAEGIQQEYAGIISNAFKQRDAAYLKTQQEAANKLMQELGSEYTNKLNLAKKFVEKLGGPKTVDAFGELGDNPEVLKFLINAASKFTEDTPGNLRSAVLGGSKSEAQGYIDECKQALSSQDKNHPYSNENHPKHREAIKKLQEAYRIVNSKED